MQLKRFQAPNAVLAYERVREALGDDAVIVSTRNVSVPGVLGGDGARFVEVMAGVPESAGVHVPLAQDIAAHELVRGMAEAAAVSPLPVREVTTRPVEAEPELAPPFVNELAGAWQRGETDLAELKLPASLDSELAPEAADFPPPIEEVDELLMPAMRAAAAEGERALLGAIADQVTNLRQVVDRLATDRMNERVDAGPEALHELRSRLIDQGLTPAVLIPLMDEVAASVSATAVRTQVLETAERKLAAQLPPVAQISLEALPATVFVVGPGGSGKTSVAVRLARMLAAQTGLRTALAGIDVARAGAPQQLTACGHAAGVPVHLCYAPEDLEGLLAGGAADVVVVDTPGHNGTNREHLTELNAFLQAASHPSMLLTLPATTKAADLLRLTTGFAPFGLTGLVPTRIDETTTFGGITSAAIESETGIAYAGSGDLLTQGLLPGDNQALASAVLLGRWPRKATPRAAVARAA